MGAFADRTAAWVLDTHAFAFSPAFVETTRLPRALDGTFDTLVKDMDRAGVERTLATLFVTPEDDFFESVQAGLARHSRRVAAQLNIPPNRPQWAAANLLMAAHDPAVGGARAALTLFRLHPIDESIEQVWDACQEARLPVQIVVDGSRYSDPKTVGIMASARPEMALVLSLASARHRDGLPALLRHPRVFFQVPALLDSELKAGRPAFLRWALRRLAPERLMFGSDRLGHELTYFAKVEALREAPPGARRQLARETALDVYGERLAAWRGP